MLDSDLSHKLFFEKFKKSSNVLSFTTLENNFPSTKLYLKKLSVESFISGTIGFNNFALFTLFKLRLDSEKNLMTSPFI